MTAEQPLPSSDFVPGKVRCAVCNFSLQRVVLYMGNGASGPGDERIEPCPNDGNPLLPVTWETEARESWRMAEEQFERARAAECQLAALRTEQRPADGWRLVPVEPTREMLKAGADAENNDGVMMPQAAWRYMLAAAPIPTQPQVAQAGEDARDAARYRWLRDVALNASDDIPEIYIAVDSPNIIDRWALGGPPSEDDPNSGPEGCDRAIDAAMKTSSRATE